MALLAAFKTVLSHYSGQTDIAVGTPVAGRSRPELEQLIGFFVNTLVLRTDLSGRPTFRQLLARVRDTALGAFDHQDVPFERLVQDLQPDRNLDRTPLFQVMFGLQNAPVHTIDLDHLQLTTHPIETDAAKFDLTLYFQEVDDRMEGVLTYASDLFEPATMRRVPADFTGLLRRLLAEPDLSLDDHPALPPLVAQPATDMPSGGGAGAGPDRSATGYAAPRSALERLFAVAIASALGLDRVSVHDDFFRLGGHSLLAMRMLARVEDAVGLQLPLRRFFDTPTAAGCAAAALEAAGGDETLEERAALVLEIIELSDAEVNARLGAGAGGAPATVEGA
jgi:non-ribosomal peptide synthetase component F